MNQTERAAVNDAVARHPSAWKRRETELWEAVIAAADPAVREDAARRYIDHHMTRKTDPRAA